MIKLNDDELDHFLFHCLSKPEAIQFLCNCLTLSNRFRKYATNLKRCHYFLQYIKPDFLDLSAHISSWRDAFDLAKFFATSEGINCLIKTQNDNFSIIPESKNKYHLFGPFTYFLDDPTAHIYVLRLPMQLVGLASSNTTRYQDRVILVRKKNTKWVIQLLLPTFREKRYHNGAILTQNCILANIRDLDKFFLAPLIYGKVYSNIHQFFTDVFDGKETFKFDFSVLHKNISKKISIDIPRSTEFLQLVR